MSSTLEAHELTQHSFATVVVMLTIVQVILGVLQVVGSFV
jgi:hypothetical protein